MLARQDLAQHAFHDAVHAFSSELSKDPKKTKLLQDLRINNVEAVLEAVLQAQKHYQERRGDSKLRHVLDGLAERIGHYGAILDVFVSHHPEYVALVWGAMKVLFVVGLGSLNKTIRRAVINFLLAGRHKPSEAPLPTFTGPNRNCQYTATGTAPNPTLPDTTYIPGHCLLILVYSPVPYPRLGLVPGE